MILNDLPVVSPREPSPGSPLSPFSPEETKHSVSQNTRTTGCFIITLAMRTDFQQNSFTIRFRGNVVV